MLVDGCVDFSTAKLISKEDSIFINQRSRVDSGDIMFAMIGSIANPVLYYGDEAFSIKTWHFLSKLIMELIWDMYIGFYLLPKKI